MGTIRQAPSGLWRAEVKQRGVGKGRWSRSLRTRAAARRWMLETEDLVAQGVDPDIEPDVKAAVPSVAEWSERWLTARVAEPTTLAGDRSRMAQHVVKRWGELPLDEVSPLDVQGWVRGLSRTHAADTVRKIHSLLAQLMADAVKERLITHSPCEHTDLPTVPPGREVWLTEAQVAKIADAALKLGHRQWGKGPGGNIGSHGGNAALASGARDTVADKPAGHGTGNARFESSPVGQAYALIWTLYLTGARWGEATGLRVQDLDFLRRRIRIAQVNTRAGLKAYPKGRRNRTVPMPGQLSDVLAAHLASRTTGSRTSGTQGASARSTSSTLGRSGPAGRSAAAGSTSRPDRSALVFANSRGGPVSDANFRHRIWWPAVNAAGLGDLRPRLHDLRHSLASRLVQQGVPVYEIAAQLGHGSSRTTERYSHLGEGRHDAVLEALERGALRRPSRSDEAR